MTVLKLSQSKKQFQVITDDGDMFVTSVAYLQSLLYGNLKAPFILCNRLPLKVSDSRFKPSPLWVPPGMDKEYIKKQEALADKGSAHDSISTKGKEAIKQKAQFKDVKVW